MKSKAGFLVWSVAGALALAVAPAALSIPATDLGGYAAIGVSGNLVAGSADFGGESHAAVWDLAESTAPIDLGVLGDPGDAHSYAIAIDGPVVAGDSSTPFDWDLGFWGLDHAFACDLSAPVPEMIDLGSLGGNWSHTMALSGNIVVGYSWTADWISHPFAYDLAAPVPEMIDLGTLAGEWGQAFPFDVDGDIVVGLSDDENGGTKAFFCDLAMTPPRMVELPTGGGMESAARAVDGHLVLGEIDDRVVVWDITDLGDPQIIDLGPGTAFYDMTSYNGIGRVLDKNIAVGWTRDSEGAYQAAAWDLSNPSAPVMQLIGTLPGCTFVVPREVSGNLVVGEAYDEEGIAHAFARHLDSPGMIALDTLGGTGAMAWGVEGGRIVGLADTADSSHAALWTLPLATDEEIRDALVDLGDAITGTKDGATLMVAVSHLTKSLSPTLWLDASHPMPGAPGATVFDQTKVAVLKLVQLLTRSDSGLPPVVIQSYINELVGFARSLAEIAIADAEARGGDADRINAARTELLNGDADAARNRPHQAIDHYKLAWTIAVAA